MFQVDGVRILHYDYITIEKIVLKQRFQMISYNMYKIYKCPPVHSVWFKDVTR